MTDYIENEFAKFWIKKDILYLVYKNGISLDQPAAIKVVEDRLLLQKGKAFLIFCDLRGLKSVDKGARNYFAGEGGVLIKAIALLVKTPLTSAISGFFIKANRPTFKIEKFTKEADALEYLNLIS
ncbi:DUF7793 family protein [Flavivirga jejuensis]|uniref:DUF7793 domain-containing protein n=1 Tax=Flavivirga jejuensis TaxID=870487 RepID=A0ABT8WMG9_9FLAO|nr:hypothetical protein [Flavivirga jejuensis]MDO5974353.1 hypothetical protein [Flavivirga jejuensis]